MTNLTVVRRPGGQLSTRPLHFIWICDCSGSMAISGKIQTLNRAIREAIPHMQEAATDNPNAQVFVRAVKFSDDAWWHIAEATPVESFQWSDLYAEGLTDMGKALALVAEQLKMPPMTDRALPPVLVLISDGQPTDDFASGLQALIDQPWGKKAARIAIAIGHDADYEVLQKFIGHSEMKPLQANQPEDLIRRIRWVSTVVLKAASAPSSRAYNSSVRTNVPIPQPFDSTSASTPNVDDVW